MYEARARGEVGSGDFSLVKESEKRRKVELAQDAGAQKDLVVILLCFSAYP